MQSYLDIIRNIQANGKKKIARGYETTGLFNQQFAFDLSTGKFPILTTRRISIVAASAELWCFIHGVTSKQVFREMGCGFWDEWCNPHRVSTSLAGEALKEAMLLEDDLGPIYGFQWRAFGQIYSPGTKQAPVGYPNDQFANLCQTLRRNPDDRRMVVSAWSVNQIPQMALPPCHVLFNLVHYDGTLNLHWHQRSCDMVLGVPYNIFCYSLLLLLLARHANLKPGVVSGTLCDAHIYDGGKVDHRAGLTEQLAREPGELPSYFFTGEQKNFDIFEWKPQLFHLAGYNPHEKISFPVAV